MQLQYVVGLPLLAAIRAQLAGEAVMVDVRSKAGYEQSHYPGAIRAKTKAQLRKLPVEIIAPHSCWRPS